MRVVSSKRVRLLLSGFLGGIVVCLASVVECAERLPAIAADLSQTSTSGISSGGYMAVQLHVAYSSLVRGAGVLAGGPYYCAQGSAWTAIYNCMKPGAWTPLPSVDILTAQTELLAHSGQIDATSSLHGANVWLFSGRSDDTVRPVVMEALRSYYQRYAAKIAYVDNVNAGHAMVTNDYGDICAATAPPYINDCHYDAAGALLTHIYGFLSGPATPNTRSLFRFDQREFSGGTPYSQSLDEEGLVYLPQGCRAGGCRIHVAYHGCGQGVQAVGDRFVQHAGYNRWAEANRIVVLYPQAIPRYGWGPWNWPTSFVYNPNGCWDWWGYTGLDYATKSGAQIRAVKAMLDRLGQKPN